MTKFDRRLLGTWKSDRRKTFLHYKPLKHFAPERFRKFRSLFGQMIIHWERGKFTITLKEMTNTTAYQVVARDDCSVVIQSHDDLSIVNRSSRFISKEKITIGSLWTAATCVNGFVASDRDFTSVAGIIPRSKFVISLLRS